MSAKSAPEALSQQTGAYNWRRTALLLALGSSLALSVWTYWQGDLTPGEDDLLTVRPAHERSNTVKPGHAMQLSETSKGKGSVDGPFQAAGSDSVPAPAARVAAKVLLDPFAPLTIAPPSAPKVEPVPAVVLAVPTAPVLPFQYMGKLEQPKKLSASDSRTNGEPKDVASAGSMRAIVYLARGNDSYSVSPGDNIDGLYRFVGIEGDNLVFEYLPLAQRQTLSLGP